MKKGKEEEVHRLLHKPRFHQPKGVLECEHHYRQRVHHLVEVSVVETLDRDIEFLANGRCLHSAWVSHVEGHAVREKSCPPVLHEVKHVRSEKGKSRADFASKNTHHLHIPKRTTDFDGSVIRRPSLSVILIITICTLHDDNEPEPFGDLLEIAHQLTVLCTGLSCTFRAQ